MPCGACRQCCFHEHVFLHPERGDDPDAYRTKETFDPTVNMVRLELVKRADGSCTYLGPRGCTIHERAPSTCRKFDCKALYVRLAALLPEGQMDKLLPRMPVLAIGARRARGERP